MHWLPITEHIKYKVKSMGFQAINGSGTFNGFPLQNTSKATLNVCAFRL